MQSFETILKLLGIERGHSPLDSDDSIEAIAAARVLAHSGCEVTKFEKWESPDLIATTSDGTTIGVEITKLPTEYIKEYQSLKQLVTEAEKLFKERYPNEPKVFAEIYFTHEELSFKGYEKESIARQIADYIYEKLNGQCVADLDFCLAKQLHRQHDRVGFFFREKNWKRNILPKQLLLERIHLKEAKLAAYRTSMRTVDQYWLVMTVDDLTSAMYEYDEATDYTVTESEYDRIVLLLDFKNLVIAVKG